MKKVSDNKKVIAVVVTFNRKDLLHECIEALLHQDYENCHVLVIDNASTDGTEESLKKYFKNKKFNYYNTGKNLGGAGGFNYGMKKAYEIGCDYVWLMDDDCIVHDDSLAELIKHANKLKDNFGFLSSKVLWKDDSICKMNVQKNSLVKKNDDWTTDRVKVIMATFVSFLVSTKVVENVGFPITDFFIWADDLEYSRRISRKYNCYLINDSVVTHKSKTNIGSNIALDNSENLSRYSYSYRNERYLYRREGFFGKLYYFLKLQYHKIKILKSNSENKNEKINIIKKASIAGKKFNPKIELTTKKNKIIAEFFGEPLNYGGQESFVSNIYQNINHKNLTFEFITPFEVQNQELKDLINKNNDILFNGNYNFNSKFRKKYIILMAKKYLNSYIDIIHIHSGSIYTLYKVSKIAKKKGIKKVIVHSHATGIDNFKYRMIKKVSDMNIEKYADLFLACSKEAGLWKFPNELINKSNFLVIKNGISIEKYMFDLSKRNEYRKKFNLEGKNILCSIGRFAKEKNHLFTINVFEHYLKKDKNGFLVLVGGSGDLEEQIIEYIKNHNLNKYILILKNRNDINNILSMSDVFIMPSLWEGLGIAAIEAQVSGMPVLCSNNIPDEVKISKYFFKEEIELGPEKWANKIAELMKIKRSIEYKKLLNNKYDIKNSAKIIEDIYRDL